MGAVLKISQQTSADLESQKTENAKLAKQLKQLRAE